MTEKIGIIGGIGPEATINYYQQIIKLYQNKLGTNKQLPVITIESVNMYHMFEMLERKDFDGVANYVGQAANNLKAAGATFGLMCGNTPHIVFNQIQAQTSLPLMSIVDASLQKAQQLGLKRLLLLSTKFTMENDFFSEPFENYRIKIVCPSDEQQQFIHEKIVNELENGIVKPGTKQALLKLITQLQAKYQPDGIILGCTELPLILSQNDFDIRVFDIAQVHISAAVERLLK